MLLFCRKYCSNIQNDIVAHSTFKIIRKQSIEKNAPKSLNIKELSGIEPQLNHETGIENTNVSNEYRENDIKIQMLSRNLFEQIFNKSPSNSTNSDLIHRCCLEMQRHGIQIGESPKLPDVTLKLPQLKGNSIEKHFEIIANEQCNPYKSLVDKLLATSIPEKPEIWLFEPGWTQYNGNSAKSVDFPEESALTFDVEVCMSAGNAPTLACAVGSQYWYSWTSPDLTSGVTSQPLETKKYLLSDLIPIGKEKPKLIIGHNVSYDRARIKEQYLIEDTGTRFLDTMSLHVCVSGVTSYQRAMLKSQKEFKEDDLVWSTQSSLNNLAEVFKLYCKDEIQKEPRDIFVKGTLNDVRDNFQHLMNYCAGDVLATQKVFRVLYPMFKERFPHPATLAGMLEIGSAYLPVNSNWNRYIEESNLTYEDLDIESKYQLSRRAEEACQLMHDDKYKTDLWMWDQDWSTQPIKLKKATNKIKKKTEICDQKEVSNEGTKDNLEEESEEESEEEARLREKFQYLNDSKSSLPARRPLLPGYPNWYRKLCEKPDSSDSWLPGATDIGTGMQVTPKLLSLCWEGYPLHYLKDHGWGFLVPYRNPKLDEQQLDIRIPIEALINKCPVIETELGASEGESSYALNSLWKDVEMNLSKKDYYSKKSKKDKTFGKYKGTGVWCNVDLEGCCWFLKLPHKNGPSFRVGNPLAKDFLNKFSENVLSSDGDTSAERVIQIAKMLSYWRNNRDRIMGQLVVWLSKTEIPKSLRNSNDEYGAIIPQIVVCGTLTRRAMEPTWMTASNAQLERVGSELRSMVQAPPGYKIVGADVDSQELWIASVLGDAHATGLHGATPLGWMTLSGTKANSTDMHSVTAKAVGISRDHAKVINYARIYGAGQNFAERLLKQFNPTFSDSEAKSKAMKMFALTKGKKLYYLKDKFLEGAETTGYSGYEALRLAASQGKSVPEMFHRAKWERGTESAMFNRLEEIAESHQPVTPFLKCRLSRAIEPNESVEDRFLPTRINWVVQSGAVDFLHLMLVSMRWLMGTNIRFCLSFHDEIRYMVKDDLAYKAALALHVTNLLTRSFCSSRIGLFDLPQSVAFFSSVEVDTVLRKESNSDCTTPSNPHGLTNGYGIPKGESLDIYQTIEKVGNSDMSNWEWHMKKPKNKKMSS